MKYIFILSILIVFIIQQGCIEDNSSSEYNILKISNYCDSFIIANKNASSNDLIQKEVDQQFKEQIPKLFERNIFDDYLMKVTKITEFEPGKFSVILNRASTDKDKYTAHFDIIALTDKKTAFEIDKKFLYTISGEVKEVNPESHSYYGLGFAFTPEISIRKRHLSMGILVLKNTKFIKSDKKFIL